MRIGLIIYENVNLIRKDGIFMKCYKVKIKTVLPVILSVSMWATLTPAINFVPTIAYAASSEAQDDSTVWTRDDFNISADGKTVGGRKNVYYPETGQTVNEYVDGLSAKGKEKLKKNHHVVIPEGIEVIHECAFTGRADKVGNKHKHIDGETYIEGVTLPQSLKICLLYTSPSPRD